MARKISSHTYRRCPWSTQYKTQYYDNGFLGNSTYPNLPATNVSAHADTDGAMISAFRGTVWGFMCMDDDCWYFTTYGVRHFEC